MFGLDSFSNGAQLQSELRSCYIYDNDLFVATSKSGMLYFELLVSISI